LFNRYRRRNAANLVHSRFVHAIEKLPHVWRERLDVPPLAFGINRLERERRFSRAARAGHNRQFPEGKIDIDPFEVVLAGPANLDAPKLSWSGDAFFFDSLRTHWKQFPMRAPCANFRLFVPPIILAAFR
jgi:hypothetical protein